MDEKKNYSRDSILTNLNITLGFVAGAVWCNSNKNSTLMIENICKYPLSSVFKGALAGTFWAIPTGFVDSMLINEVKPVLGLALASSICYYLVKK